MDFQKWLRSNRSKIGGGKDLIEELVRCKITFPSDLNKLKDLESAINKGLASNDLKDNLKRRIIAPWNQFRKEQRNEPTCCSKLLDNLYIIGIILIAALILSGFGIAIFGDNSFLDKLSATEFTRGLLTFLFALGTIGIAIMIIITIYTSNREADDRKERFYRAKEILTILIGILGTIVGFYFGTATDSAKQIEKIELSEFIISTTPVIVGEPFTITTLAKGGSPPYTYTIHLMDGAKTIKVVRNKESLDGLITDSFKIGEEKEDYNITAEVIAEDAKNRLAKLVFDNIEVKKKNEFENNQLSSLMKTILVEAASIELSK